jgi:hypothetical protein
LELGLRQFEKFTPEIAGEHFVAIRNNGDRQAMELVHLKHVGLRYLKSSERVCQGNEVSVPRKLVDHYENAVGPRRSR